ncbi:MAG: adenosylcobinamide-GDP ribazoletransferase [Zavarzinia sp.]|nr:adenosylcobinamide-GDP ribazoletransferase [Zavarzinia sp.]
MQQNTPDRPSRADEFRFVLGLFTRLPVGAVPEMPAGSLARAVWCFPLVGAVVGLLAGLGALVGAEFGLGPWGLAVLAIAIELLATGALHEDGFADVADSFGGRDRETRLRIMRDSRIGSFGAVALWLLLSARLVFLAGASGAGVWTLVFALVAANTAARLALLIPLVLLPAARSDGLGAGFGTVGRDAGASAVVFATGIGIVCLGGGVFGAALAVLIAGIAMSALGRQNLGGHTGDLLGATAALTLPLVLAVAGGHV